MRAYQERIVQHIKDHPNCAVWAGMGLGKTVSTLTAIRELQESFDVHKVLLIAPLRVARKTWDDEIDEWEHLQGMTTSHIIGNERQRLAGISAEADIYCINRENVVWLVDQFVRDNKLIRKWPWDTVVIDESSSFKNSSAKRFKAIRKMRRLIERLIELTGTPAPNGYMDLWAQINLLDRGERLGRTKYSFLNRWFMMSDRPQSSGQGKYLLLPESQKDIEKRLDDIVISLRSEDYMELPPVQSNKVPVYLDPSDQDTYNDLQTRFATEVGGASLTAANAGVLAGKLLQLANGAVYVDAGGYEIFHDKKIAELIDILEFSSGPVMVTAWYRSDMERVQRAVSHWCKKNGKTWEVLTDEASEDRWNNGETDVLVLHPGSAGHGLNLHKNDCETIVWFGLTWSLELYQQLNARIAGGHRRIGKNVRIHHIITAETIDEYVWSVIGRKGATQAALLAALRVIVKQELEKAA
jgi:SNF2 family DNA or RNA helicase